jgi:hypothetical protein
MQSRQNAAGCLAPAAGLLLQVLLRHGELRCGAQACVHREEAVSQVLHVRMADFDRAGDAGGSECLALSAEGALPLRQRPLDFFGMHPSSLDSAPTTEELELTVVRFFADGQETSAVREARAFLARCGHLHESPGTRGSTVPRQDAVVSRSRSPSSSTRKGILLLGCFSRGRHSSHAAATREWKWHSQPCRVPVRPTTGRHDRSFRRMISQKLSPHGQWTTLLRTTLRDARLTGK